MRDLGEVKGGIVTFTIDGKAPKEINATLAKKKINTTSSSIFSTRFDMENSRSNPVRAGVSALRDDGRGMRVAGGDG